MVFYNLQHWSVVDEKTQQHNNQQAFYGNEPFLKYKLFNFWQCVLKIWTPQKNIFRIFI